MFSKVSEGKKLREFWGEKVKIENTLYVYLIENANKYQRAIWRLRKSCIWVGRFRVQLCLCKGTHLTANGDTWSCRAELKGSNCESF